jgi:hypothetical protein
MVGDVNHDGTIKASDLIALVRYLFKGGADPACPDEADVNLNGVTNASDLIFLVAYVFRGGPAPGACPPLIGIINLQPGNDTVSGWASVEDTALYRVVLWAKTDRWYVQPLISEPYTPIHSDGSWSNFTNPWQRIVALLVDSDYVPGSIREEHPSDGAGVIDWDEYPVRSADTYISWSGYRWRVKEAELTGPGPNAFSADTGNVQVDSNDRLHLKIDFRDKRWHCGEIILDHSLGYGVYRFKIDSRVDTLNFNTIFAGFVYDSTGQEIDIEFSQLLAYPSNAQYVLQPWYLPGHIDFYNMPNGHQSSHTLEWRSDRIVFSSWNGHADGPELNTLIHTWIYSGNDIPIPRDDRMRFNLYLAGGDPPTEGREDEVIITSFEFTE